MKLFQKSDTFVLDYSLEQYSSIFNTSETVAVENLSDYFYKLKDVFNSVIKTIASRDVDKIIRDTEHSKFEVIHKLKRANFNDFKDYMVSKPENFKGKYIDYSADLIKTANFIYPDTIKCIDSLKIAVATFINEYAEDKIFTIFGTTYFTQSKNLVSREQTNIATYFPVANNTTKASVKDVLKTFNDIEPIYKNINTLGSILNDKNMTNISKMTQEVADLVDILINQYSKTTGTFKNDDVKKELISAIHIAAKEVEFLNYLYANSVILYGSFKNLTDELKKFPI